MGHAVPGVARSEIQVARGRITADERKVIHRFHHLPRPLVLDGAGVRTGPEGLPRPRVRTNGIGLPGGALGWFRTDARRVFAAYNGVDDSVYVPTRGDFDVLVSPGDAARIVEALAQRTGEPARR